jgi:four helix bundle protein
MGCGLLRRAKSVLGSLKEFCKRESHPHCSLGHSTPGAACVGDFKKLEVWQLAHKIACEIYHETSNFPKTEAYGLTTQLRRSAASIPANIAEGCGRRGDLEFSRFVRISLGSATELEYHLLLSRDIGLLNGSIHSHLSEEVLRVQGMLAGLNRVLRRRQSRSRSQPIAHSP